ncbi:YdcF family protein [Consotaella aegiceratis]|uniref:YdcF family protein n=1 Tax=Consotaella aegiceratis TaxID=3097961 RepID=UPI002F3F64D7
MFFILSKIVWFVIQPLAAIVLLGALGLVLRWFGVPRLGTTALVLACVALLIVVFSPLGLLMMSGLENRFPRPQLPETVTGIVVLGGSFDTRVARTRDLVEFNEAADRLTATVTLARRYPDAKILFTGGVAAILEDDIPEVRPAAAFFDAMGLPRDRLILEGKSRNTVENAEHSRALVDPQPGDTWLLVTSAFHMPRAVGCFRKVGFDVIPYPVDYRTPAGAVAWRPSTMVTRNVEKVDIALREYIGLLAYWWTGRIESVFPAPR